MPHTRDSAAGNPGDSGFDAAWYHASFPDVALLGMAPETHFRRYGRLMGRAPNARAAQAGGRASATTRAPQTTPPRPGTELLAAHEIARRGDHEGALAFARGHLPPEFAHTLHVLAANRAAAGGDRAGWLGHLNRYLAHFGMAPLRLTGDGHDNLLAGLTGAAPLPAVTDGPLVSVIMPAFNAGRTIDYAIRSILDQSWRNLELLVVDDASSDGTGDIIRSLAARDSRIRPLHNAANVGPYVSKNIALTQARGEWITGHDADDWAHPERIARQMDFCDTSKTPVCMSGTVRMAADGSFVRLARINEFHHDGACRSALISLMVHAQYFHDLPGFWDSVRVSGDAELLRRIEALRGRPVPQLARVTMLCLDNPAGLTNHPTLGHSAAGISPHRQQYRRAYTGFHAGLTPLTGRLAFPAPERRFPVPAEISVRPEAIAAAIEGHERAGLRLSCRESVDVALVTSLRFPGGNASSTMDEALFLRRMGLSVKLVHAPVDIALGRPRADRFRPLAPETVNWSAVQELSARVVIARQPWVLTSHAFREIAPRITAGHLFVVVNNSHLRESGEPVYDRGDLIAAVQTVRAGSVTFCPISPVIRAELQEHIDATGAGIRLSAEDWTPTFTLEDYRLPPQARMQPPFCIGRHGRDGLDKWLEEPGDLRRAYPAGADFRIAVLGGARRADQILGARPANWTVHEFGSLAPRDYLRGLDAFVFFPHSRRIEAFGRTIVEAMLAARPVILPHSFEATFGDLPLYATPDRVEGLVRALARDDAGRIAWLREVQAIAAARYASPVIARRLAGTGLDLAGPDSTAAGLSPAALRFRQRLDRAARE